MASVASKSSTYLQSLVDYVLDVKPYHTKMSVSGAVSETYIFSDTLHVDIHDQHAIKAFLGADLLPAEFSSSGVRLRQSDSWWKDLISDGVRSVWPIPAISNPKFASVARQDRFERGVDDVSIIPGLVTSVFNPRRWDGPGISEVRLNGEPIHDTVDYHLSHGVFSFDILDTKQWIRRDIRLEIEPAFGANDGTIKYNNVERPGGSLTTISGFAYEEFRAICTSLGPATLSVYGGPDLSDLIGTVEFGDEFTAYIDDNPSNPIRIQFAFTFAPGEVTETAQLGDVWYITPVNQIVVNPVAPEETWSLIKVNPSVFTLDGEPQFIPAEPRDPDDIPGVTVYTRSLEFTDHPLGNLTWTLTFGGDGTYTLYTDLPGYPVEGSLRDGCSYKDDNIAFTIIPTVTGWNAGDQFTWTTRNQQTHYKVYGSVSGWQNDATVGKWYYNGLIGFKIPKLRYNVTGLGDASQFTALREPSVMTEPSYYTITFTTTSDTPNTTPAQAKVHHNLRGYQQNLVTGEDWADDYVSFRIDATALNEFSAGDVVYVHLTPMLSYKGDDGFEVNPYEDQTELTIPYVYKQEIFPLYYGNGLVIIPSAQLGDTIVINKTFTDRIKFKLDQASTLHPELGTDDDWIPLFFRYFDKVEDGVATSNAEYSDLATHIEAYSAATGDRVFYVQSPRHLKTNRVANSTLTFDEDFFEDYLPYNRRYSIVVMPDMSYGQKMRVKISEALKIYVTVELVLDDIVSVSITENLDWFITAGELEFFDEMSISFVEGGALPINGYDLWGYDTLPYDFDSAYVEGVGGVFVPVPSLITGYVWTGSEWEYTGDPADWALPKATVLPVPANAGEGSDIAALIKEEPTENIAESTITEGLTIVLTAVNTGDSPQNITTGAKYLTCVYDFNLANVAAAGVGPANMRGLTVSVIAGALPAGSQITVKMLNADDKTYPNSDPPSDVYIGYGGADLDNTVIGPITIVASRTEIDTGTILTDNDSFDIDVDADASGLQGPFRIWIV